MNLRWLALCGLMTIGAPALAHDIQQVENVVTFNTTVSSDLRTRNVSYLRPTRIASGKAPALVLLHYLYGNPADMADLTNAARLARDAGVWVIVPEGLIGKWNYGPTSVKTVNDIKFLEKVIDDALARFPIDPKRVYMAGYSNGGLMAQRFACESPSRIAAVGVVSTTIENSDSLHCTPPMGTPIMYINGVDDPIVAFYGNAVKRSADQTVAMWRGINGCSDAVVRTDIPDRYDDGTSVYTNRYGDCANGAAVQQYVIAGGGHTWPGSFRLTLGLGITSQEINATDIIWQFVSQFSRP